MKISKKQIEMTNELEKYMKLSINWCKKRNMGLDETWEYISPIFEFDELQDGVYGKDSIEYFSDFLSQFYLAVYKRVMEIDHKIDIQCFFGKRRRWASYMNARIIYVSYLKKLKRLLTW